VETCRAFLVAIWPPLPSCWVAVARNTVPQRHSPQTLDALADTSSSCRDGRRRPAAVSDLSRSRAFYESLGCSVNDNAVSIVISDTITAMLLTREFFAEFTSKSIIDATTSTEVQLALSAESKGEVDAIHAKALGAGGTPAGEQDHGFMYSTSFDDLDGHHWDHVWMDPEAAAGGAPEMTVDEMRVNTTHS
jgi:predicted lactoylglutathione lyase